jgi:hypothetical protein
MVLSGSDIMSTMKKMTVTIATMDMKATKIMTATLDMRPMKNIISMRKIRSQLVSGFSISTIKLTIETLR